MNGRPSLTARMDMEGMTLGHLREFVEWVTENSWPDDAHVYVLDYDGNYLSSDEYRLEIDTPEISASEK